MGRIYDSTRQERIACARTIIRAAERDLGPLAVGQRRDLLADNTMWDMDEIAAVVAAIAGLDSIAHDVARSDVSTVQPHRGDLGT